MGIKNTKETYGAISKTIHWITAILVIGMLVGGFFMDGFDKTLKPTIYMLHKSFGLLILALVICRLIWNVSTGMPGYEESLSRVEQKISTAGHHLLYLLLFIMPLTGLFMSVASKRYPSFFEIFTIGALPGIPQTKAFAALMNSSHEVIAWIFIAFVALHIAAACKHHFILKNGVMNRMLANKK